MSAFSNLLKDVLNAKSVDKLQLSGAMGIDRALLYRYLNDQSFPDRSFLSDLRAELLLTPYEYRDLLRAYEMTRLGETVFENRRIVSSIIQSIYRQSEKLIGLNNTVSTAGFPVKDIVTLSNSDSVYWAVQQILQDPRTQNVMLTLQPDQEFVHHSVTSLLVSQARLRPLHIEHIVRFQSKSLDSHATYNLKIFSHILPALFACNYYTDSQYFVYYYYNNQVSVDERAMELYPHALITSWCVCLFSFHYNSAVIIQDPAVAQLYRNNFLSIQDNTSCFLKEAVTADGESTLMQRLTHEPYFECIFKTHPSVSLAGNEKHYAKYYQSPNNTDTTLVDNLIHRYHLRMQAMNSEFYKGRRDFFTFSGLRRLVYTGRFSNSPDPNIPAMDHEDIRCFIENYLQKLKTLPHFEAHLVKEDTPGMLSGDFGIYIINNNSMIIEKARRDTVPKRHLIEVTEKSIVNAFLEYLQNGIEFEEIICSNAQTIALLESLLKVDLDIDRLAPIL